jgi:1,4-dihydroxy-2-naphthoyl-CoA hydrolase
VVVRLPLDAVKKSSLNPDTLIQFQRSIMADQTAQNMTTDTSVAARIWREEVALDDLNALARNTMLEQLGIVITRIGDDFLEGTMPVDRRTHQPMGILHGGASVALAETLGSIAGSLCVPEGETCVGIEVNANHVRSLREGMLTGRAAPIHIGRSTQVWEIRMQDERERLVCISRLTLAVIKRR